MMFCDFFFRAMVNLLTFLYHKYERKKYVIFYYTKLFIQNLMSFHYYFPEKENIVADSSRHL